METVLLKGWKTDFSPGLYFEYGLYSWTLLIIKTKVRTMIWQIDRADAVNNESITRHDKINEMKVVRLTQ